MIIMLVKNLWLIRGVVESRDFLATSPQNFPGSTIGFWKWLWWKLQCWSSSNYVNEVDHYEHSRLDHWLLSMCRYRPCDVYDDDDVGNDNEDDDDVDDDHKATCSSAMISSCPLPLLLFIRRSGDLLEKKKNMKSPFFYCLEKKKPWIQLMAMLLQHCFEGNLRRLQLIATCLGPLLSLTEWNLKIWISI